MNDDVKAVVEMVRKLAVVVDALEQRARQSDQMQQQTTQALQQALSGVRSDVDRLVQGAEHRTAQTVRQSMDAALGDLVARSDLGPQGERQEGFLMRAPADFAGGNGFLPHALDAPCADELGR